METKGLGMKLARIAPVLMIMLALNGTLAPRASADVKIATVNVGRVFQDMQETKDLQAKMESDQKALQAQDAEKKQHIKDLQAARDALKPDAPQYADADKQLLQAGTEYEIWGRIQTSVLQREQKQDIVRLYNKITAAVGEIATQKGLDLVLTEQKPDIPENLDPVTPDQLRGLLSQRNVLFSSPAVDITADVTAAMDAKYKAGK
jgi:Skp family chaperone for outer membrane proteins